jgi:hypothetical protein
VMTLDDDLVSHLGTHGSPPGDGTRTHHPTPPPKRHQPTATAAPRPALSSRYVPIVHGRRGRAECAGSGRAARQGTGTSAGVRHPVERQAADRRQDTSDTKHPATAAPAPNNDKPEPNADGGVDGDIAAFGIPRSDRRHRPCRSQLVALVGGGCARPRIAAGCGTRWEWPSSVTASMTVGGP